MIMKHTSILAVVMISACLLLVGEAPGLINANFTPIHLVKQSEIILQLKIRAQQSEGKLAFTVENVLKGKEDAKTLDIDLTGTAFPDHAKAAAETAAKSQDKLALVFIASWPDKPGENTGEQPATPAGQPRNAFLHIDGSWYLLQEDKGGWKFNQESIEMVSTWNGGSDMLLKLTKYILDDPANATVANRTGTCWANPVDAGKIAGNVAAAAAVDLKRNGVPLLFIASDAGDKLFEVTDKAEDVTVRYKLQSKSAAFAWSDFNGDGRLDLASWNGKSLTIHLQGSDGTFIASAGAKELSECIGLTALDIGSPAKGGLLISTSGSPMLLAPEADAVAKKLVEGDAPGKDLGKAGPCLLADFDGDSWLDIIQPFAKGSLFYKGTGAGTFKAPVACQASLGEEPATASIGDWNGDGLLDVFTAANDRNHLWENQGEGRFADRMRLTGEMRYTGSERASGIGLVCDLNNDGWQDLAVVHNEGFPQVYFNRAFRAFGLSVSMDMSKTTLLPESGNGQKAACVADFNGDGCQDLAMVLKDGQCAVMLRLPTESDLCARVSVSPKAKSTGPVRVWAVAGKKTLGVWSISAGSAPAFLCRSEAGEMTVKWQFPGQAEQSRTIALERKPVSVRIEPPTSK
jgi:hypothetical protein